MLDGMAPMAGAQEAIMPSHVDERPDMRAVPYRKHA